MIREPKKPILIRSCVGTKFPLLAITDSVDEANAYCEQNEQAAVLAERMNAIIIASIVPAKALSR